MGMAYPEPLPRTNDRNGLLGCLRCGARYSRDASFEYGQYGPGTAMDFWVLGRVKKGECPICVGPRKISWRAP